MRFHLPQSLSRRIRGVVLILTALILAIGMLGNPAWAEILFWPARLDFRAGDRPISVAIGDLNSDEVPDLAVGNYLSDDVAVLLGTGGSTSSGVGASAAAISRFSLVAPNPVGSLTTIRFSLAQPGRTKLWVVDACGRLVEALLDQTLVAGHHDVVWDLTQGADGRVPIGVYFLRIETTGYRAGQRLVVLR
ncbi:MAG: T9SS type A sorting domain-containing protein [Candidatus Eisenbacteria sp.]|nr:T9SS type A sorting domain-containing protein [Candidatus Eisenbacteria bacterium]